MHLLHEYWRRYFFYSWNNSGECVRYSDADWAGDINDRKSMSGYVLQINGAPVMWRSKKQVCVALSTAEEEEYV